MQDGVKAMFLRYELMSWALKMQEFVGRISDHTGDNFA